MRRHTHRHHRERIARCIPVAGQLHGSRHGHGDYRPRACTALPNEACHAAVPRVQRPGDGTVLQRGTRRKGVFEKAERKRILNGETDSLSSRARTVRTRETIPYSATIILPENTCTAKISAAIATYGCGKCIATDTVDMAYVSDLSTLADISFLLACSRPEFAIRPKK